MNKLPIFKYINLKLATRCNLNCTYCYWFRDATVYKKPPVLTIDAEDAFMKKLESHIVRYGLSKFSILFHGGEPLLFGKKRFVGFMDKLASIKNRTNCEFDLSMTTNGTLIDHEWAQLFRIFGVSVTLSIDGPEEIHDKFRIDFEGKGSLKQVIRGLEFLRQEGLEPGVLAVCNPNTDPEIVTRYFVGTLNLKHFDILVPDATHEDKPHSIAKYYKKLFDLWYNEYSKQGIEIRYPRSLVKGLLGGDSHFEAIGYGPIETLIMLTDGSLEPLDVLRIAGDGSTHTSINIQTHTFQDVTSDPVWLEAYHASLNLCETCQKCEYYQACGGGYLPHRWSNERRYDNVSVYCDDLKEIFDHIWSRIASDIDLCVQGQPLISLLQAYNMVRGTVNPKEEVEEKEGVEEH